MTDTDERVTRLLGALAERADDHADPQRVSRVRTRARRAAAVRAGVVVGGLAIAAALVGSVPFVRDDGRAEPADQIPVVVATPGLQIDLEQDVAMGRSLPRRQPGAIAVFTVHIHGMVPARQVKEVSPSGREHLSGLRILYGDRMEGSTLDASARCAPGGALVRVDDEFLHTVWFEKAGTHQVTVETGGCAPVGTVRQTITVQAD